MKLSSIAVFVYLNFAVDILMCVCALWNTQEWNEFQTFQCMRNCTDRFEFRGFLCYHQQASAVDVIVAAASKNEFGRKVAQSKKALLSKVPKSNSEQMTVGNMGKLRKFSI